jgi:magnesium chelatase family protein
MPSKLFSGAIVGLHAQLVEVEIDVSHGLRSFTIVGLPDKTVEESKERIKSAIKSSKLLSPNDRTLRVLVNLAPADVKKEGSLYDLPIALAFLVATKQIMPIADDKLLLGELSLDGKLRPIKGALSFALLAKKQGFKEIILPRQNTPEASLIEGINAIGIESLNQAVAHLENRSTIKPASSAHINSSAYTHQEHSIDISWINGQEYAKRALEVAGAGGHNLFFSGPPGGGKSLLAKALPSILPLLTFDESLEVTNIYSIAGLLKENQTTVNLRPFRAPHHVSSEAALLGGGSPLRPGEITLAHRGVLFLDEFPEFHRDVLESLRQPIEEGHITISRAKNTTTFPSRFMLVGASNPCPCGFFNSSEKPCSCSASQVSMYQRKLSGPIMDRIDIAIEVPAVSYEKLTSKPAKLQTQLLRENIRKARLKQEERFLQSKDRIMLNSEMNIAQIQQYCSHDLKSQALMKKYVDSGKLSARGYHRVLKVARTIADLANSENITHDHMAEALMYRIKN